MKHVRPSGVVATGLLLGVLGCSRAAPTSGAADASAPVDAAVARAPAGTLDGLAAPIAATHRPSGDVVVVGLDPSKRAVRAVRVASGGERVVASAVVLEDVEPSPEADLKIFPAEEGVTVVWRGKQKGALVRQAVALTEQLARRRAPVDVGAAVCSTRDAIVHVDGGKAHALHYRGGLEDAPLGVDAAEATVVCAASRAFVVLEGDDDVRIAPFGARDEMKLFSKLDLDAGTLAAIETKLAPKVVLREKDYGKDELRERTDLALGDEMGVLRIGASGSVVLRETKDGEPAAPLKLKTTIRQEHDVVAVDASGGAVFVVFTEDAGESCPDKVGPWTKVKVLRVDRTSHEETVSELEQGACGHELGPFTTSHLGTGINVAWVDRVPTQGKARAPIAGFSHASVTTGGAGKVVHVAEPADALSDAGCDGARCYMAVLRRPDGDASASGSVRVRAYAP